MSNYTNIHPVTKVVWNYFPETKPPRTGWYLTAIECADGSLQVLSNKWEDYGWRELGNHVYAWSFEPDAPPMQNEMEGEK